MRRDDTQVSFLVLIRRRRVAVVALLALVGLPLLGWFAFLRLIDGNDPPQKPSFAGASKAAGARQADQGDPEEKASPALQASPSAVPAAHAEDQAAPGAPSMPQSSVHEALQRRLDAIAQAYNDGDPQAAERAMWKNHAVVRSNGKTMDRSELLGKWMTEWDQFGKRNLSFAIEEVTEEGATVSAMWAVHLTAEIAGADGELHQLEFTGTQKAVYERSGEDEWLTGPIVYVGVEQTLDGFPWRGEE